MSSPVVRGLTPIGAVGLKLLMVWVALAAGSSAPASTRGSDPASVVPLSQITPEYREIVSDVIRNHTLHRKGEPESFPCHSNVYLTLLNEPSLTLALWKDLSPSPVQLQRVAPNRYEGKDGAGASAVWEFVYRSPKLHVMLADLDYKSPRGAARVEARIVLVVHSGYRKEVNGDPWVQHDVEAFVKVESRGWKTVARTMKPVIEKVLEDQVQEAGWFVSLMGRLVAAYPNWACQVAQNQPEIAAETRTRFNDLVIQTKKPGAFTGRPVLAENSAANDKTRIR
jgi:hypothetical protein